MQSWPQRAGAVLALLLLLCAGHASAGIDPLKLVAAARAQVGVTLGYDGSYRRLDYPGGDVPRQTGVCTDVLIRALREQGLDLQQEVHEDMRRHFAQYPRHWGLGKPDASIDHRRVPNLMTFLNVGDSSNRFQAGPVITRPVISWPGTWAVASPTSACCQIVALRVAHPW